MKLNAVHHIAIIVSDYARSKRFYVDLLGLEILRENYRADRDSYKLDLKIGDLEIELFSMPSPPPRVTQPEACGLRHLAFRTADIERQVAQLSAAGIATEPIRIDEYTNKRFTFFTDPDGLPLELHE